MHVCVDERDANFIQKIGVLPPCALQEQRLKVLSGTIEPHRVSRS
jgi:hypothetical protein